MMVRPMLLFIWDWFVIFGFCISENLYNTFIKLVFESLQRFQTDEPIIKSERITMTVADSKYEEKVKDYRKLFLFAENSKLAVAIEESLCKSGSINAKILSEDLSAYALFQR